MVGMTSKTREATQTVGLHGQHQAVDKNNNITVRTGCRRPQLLEGNRQSSDTGQQSNIICRNEEDTAHRALSPTTSLFGSAFLCHDKHVPCGAMQPTTNSRCRKKNSARGPPRPEAPGTCPIGPMVNPALVPGG